MNKPLYAKSLNNGGTFLKDHLLHVSFIAVKFAEAVGLDTSLAKKGGLLHDIGKAPEHFQEKLDGNSSGYNFEIPFRHEIASILFLPLVPRPEWPVLTDMIIAHHKSIGRINKINLGTKGIVSLCDRNGYDEVFRAHSLGWDEWMPRACAILAELEMEVRAITLSEAREAFDFAVDYCEKKSCGWSQWKGLLVGADHFASALGEATFARAENIFIKPDLSAFNTRSSYLYPLSLLPADDPRRHTITTAPTGAGKTDYLMRRCRSRVFYTLPFQASINAMYKRLDNAIPNTEVRVLHAASRLVVSQHKGDEECAMQELIGAGVKVLTPHQLAALICGTRGFETIAMDIADADVILDEIHCYSGKVQSMVLEIIKVLLRLGCNIHVGTATMPASLYSQVLELLGGETEVCCVNLDESTLDSFNRHHILRHNSEAEAFEILKEALEIQEKVLIVSNRVDLAQQRFERLSNEFPDIPIMLIHSRFRRCDRNNKEQELYDRFNQGNGPCIVVATQVVEVSLDISFDRMITDCAPLDALVQRFGRVNRVRTAETLGRIRTIHVIAPPGKISEARPYDLDVLQRSFNELPHDEILRESSIQERINKVYPCIEPLPIGTHLIWEDNECLITELCHYPKAVLMEMLNIESGTVILESDREAYEKGDFMTRTMLEIPIPRKAMFGKFTRLGQLEVGNHPFVVPDELYSQRTGLKLAQIENFI